MRALEIILSPLNEYEADCQCVIRDPRPLLLNSSSHDRRQSELSDWDQRVPSFTCTYRLWLLFMCDNHENSIHKHVQRDEEQQRRDSEKI